MTNDEELKKIRQKMIKEIIMEKKESKIIDKPLVLNDNNFHKTVEKYNFMIVDFWAPWCGPCRMMGPIIEQLAKDYAGKIVFGKLNTVDNQEMPIKYQVMSIPAFLIFKDGKLVDRIIGAMPKNIFESKIKKYI
jgi:thioredoxin 1